jgi:hypothetical protein
MRSKWTFLFIALFLLSFPIQGRATVYMISYEPNWGAPAAGDAHWAALYTVNISNGAATKVGNIECQGNQIVLTDIAFSPDTRKLYAINGDDSGTQLYTLDYLNPVSGVVKATLLCSFDVIDLQGLAMSPEGEYLYAGSGTTGTAGETPGDLYLIYPLEAKISLVGSLGSLSSTQPIGMGYGNSYVFGGDLELDSNKIMYGSVSTATADHSADIFSFSTLDPGTGKATLIGNAFDNGAITGLAFVPGSYSPGIMYACDYSGAFYQLNTEDGSLVFLGSNAVCQVGMTYAPPVTDAQVPAHVFMMLLD